jgi:glycosyltransferase involved in cell wall biosynthesis
MSEGSLRSNDIVSTIDRPIKIHYVSTSNETFFYNIAFQIACFAKIPSLHRKYEFDIIHSHLCHMPDVFLRLFNRIQVPTVLTVHGTIQMLREHAVLARSSFGNLESGEDSMLSFYPIIRLLQQNYVKHVARFIAVSNATKELAIKHLEIEERKINMVYNGVDTKIFSTPGKEEFETRYAKPTVLYIGRMVSKKGIHVLIKAMPEVLRVFPEARFLFVGGGNIPLYKEIIKKMGISERNFSFVGHLGYFERPRIMREATVVVNPSFFENCSLSILEAMSCGNAVVASNVGGNPEIIETGKNGLLVPAFDHASLAESINSLLRDENFSRKLGKEARLTVEQTFSSTVFANQTYQVYKQTLD